MQPTPAKGEKKAYSGVWDGLSKIWKEEGFRGFMRGNGINCLRIAPYSAVQFTTYESMKRWLAHPVLVDEVHGAIHMEHIEYSLGPMPRLVAGAIAGIASVVSTYPLDLVRSRISIASASMYMENKSAAEAGKKPTAPRVPGVVEMTIKVYREEGGLRGLYRGVIPTSMVRVSSHRRALRHTSRSTFSSMNRRASSLPRRTAPRPTR